MTLELQPAGTLRVLDFDIENRPLSYMGGDWTSAEITAIGAGWVGQKRVKCWLLGQDDPGQMLLEFRTMFEVADLVTGHYIRGHDLPILQGAMLEYGWGPLPEKLVQDTKTDLLKMKDFSQSQKNLAAALGVEATKFDMTQHDWREANRLTSEGLRLSRERVVGDVHQHMEMRELLLALKWLRAPRMWRPTHSTGGYRP